MSSLRSRSGGRRRRITLRRWYKSSRNSPAARAFEVLVRGGDHAHVGAQRVVAADAVELAVRQHAQQARLQVERHVADFVEEQRAASACSKRPRRMVCAPVNAPRSWPNSSDSSRSFGIAAVFSAMNGPFARGLCLCSARPPAPCRCPTRR
jgi:hypothetical protein